VSEPASETSGSGGRQALLALAAITVVILVVMLLVLTRETTDAAGPRAASSPSASSTTTAAAPGTSSTTTIRPDKPGVAANVRNLDDANEWTAPIIGTNLQCVGPVVQDGVVIVMCNSRELKGFDARTGESLWSVKVDESPTSTFVDIPRLSGEHRVIVADNTHVESVDAKTGEIAWSLVRDLGTTSIGTSGSHVVMVGEGKALSVDADTGVKQWEFAYPGDLFTIGGMRTDTSDRDFLVAVGTGIQATALADGTSHWTRTMPDGPVQDMKTLGDNLYLLSEGGTLSALDPATGLTRWERGPTDFPGHFQSIVGLDAQHVYVVVSDELAALNPADGSTAWSLDAASIGFPGGLNQTHLTGGMLVMLAPNQLLLVEPATGVVTIKRQMNLGAAGFIHDDTLLTVLEATGNSEAPVRLVTFNLR
jgi:outer membrane protein assembly factor BamB